MHVKKNVGKIVWNYVYEILGHLPLAFSLTTLDKYYIMIGILHQ